MKLDCFIFILNEWLTLEVWQKSDKFLGFRPVYKIFKEEKEDRCRIKQIYCEAVLL